MKHFCCFCDQKINNKITRHFQRRHKEEREVADALRLGGKKMKTIWTELIRRGDHEHNIQSLKENKNDLVVVRRKEDISEDYVPCGFCKGFFAAKFIKVHEDKCFKNDIQSNNVSSLKSSRALLAAELSNGIYRDVHVTVLSSMKRDEHHLIIRNDNLMLFYGYVMLQSIDKERISDIRYALRLLSRLIIKFREITGNENASASDLVLPQNFDKVLESAKKITDYSGPRNIGSPNVFALIGYRLKNLALCARGQALRESSSVRLENVRMFLELYELDWTVQTNNAKACYEERKLNIPEKLPNEQDIAKFRTFCSGQMKILSEKYLSKGKFTAFEYRQLGRVTLARCSTFNARRGAETSKLTLSQWASVEDNRWKRSTELQNLDDPIEKKLAERLQLCYVPGKKKKGKGALVPILFTEEVVAAIRILNKERDLAGVANNNEFVFATSGDGRLKGWDVLQWVTKQIENLENPELLTPTRTRKYLATMLQLLDMSEAELTWITNHLGHTKDTHLAWYRKESSTIELTKMAKVLTAVDQGENLKKRKIDELGKTPGTMKIQLLLAFFIQLYFGLL